MDPPTSRCPSLGFPAGLEIFQVSLLEHKAGWKRAERLPRVGTIERPTTERVLEKLYQRWQSILLNWQGATSGNLIDAGVKVQRV